MAAIEEGFVAMDATVEVGLSRRRRRYHKISNMTSSRPRTPNAEAKAMVDTGGERDEAWFGFAVDEGTMELELCKVELEVDETTTDSELTTVGSVVYLP